MRKGFALGTALMMVLMAFVVLVPSGTATDDDADGTPTTPIISIVAPPTSVTVGDYWRLRISVINPLDDPITVKCILPPAFVIERDGQYRPGDFEYIVSPGLDFKEFFALTVSVGAESHWETLTVEAWDTGTLPLSSTEWDIWVYQFDGFMKDAILLSDSIELNQEINWLFEITVANTEAWIWDSMYNCVVTDSFGPDFEIVFSSMTQGAYATNGNTEITWTIGDLAPGEEATLVLELSHNGFSAPGRYQLNSGATLTFDRDGPCDFIVEHTAQTAEIVINAPGNWDIRTIGFWKHQFNIATLNKKGYQHVPTENLLAYLAEISATSTVLKLQETDTLEEALEILLTKNNADMYDKAVTQLLATWLNYVSGNDAWDSDGDGEVDTEIMGTILWAEAGLLDLDPDNDEEIKDILDMLNNSGDE